MRDGDFQRKWRVESGMPLMRDGEPTNFVLLLDGALDELLPTVCHITEQFADNPVEAGDHSATAVSIRR